MPFIGALRFVATEMRRQAMHQFHSDAFFFSKKHMGLDWAKSLVPGSFVNEYALACDLRVCSATLQGCQDKGGPLLAVLHKRTLIMQGFVVTPSPYTPSAWLRERSDGERESARRLDLRRAWLAAPAGASERASNY